MNVLIVSQYYYPDPFRLHEAAEGLVERGHEVTVLTGTPNYSVESASKKVHEKENVINGVKVKRVPTFRRRKGKISLAVSYLTFVMSACCRCITLKKDFDVIFVYQLSPILMTVPALLLRKLTKKKIALYCLDLWPESLIGMGITHKSFIYKIMKKVSIWIYDSVDKVAITSKLFSNYFQNELQIKKDEYMYIPQFAEDIYSDIQHREHMGVNYVFAGNIGEAQSVETIIKAAALLKNESIWWHIVGDGRSLDKCMELAKKENVSEKVIFYGRRPIEEMPYFYSLADAMIVTLENNPIISYTLPGKVQSYMAAGLPILAAVGGETVNIIEEANCGICGEPENYVELAENAKKLAVMDRTQLGENSKRYYQQNFTKEEYISKMEQFLSDLVTT